MSGVVEKIKLDWLFAFSVVAWAYVLKFDIIEIVNSANADVTLL